MLKSGQMLKLKILYSSDHLILIKFRQLVVNKVIKELQMVFLTSTVINSNGNMKELERKIKWEKLMFRQGISYCRCKCWHRESEMSFVIP